MEMTSKMKKRRKIITTVLCFVVLSVCASQCFAQSGTDTKKLKERQYLEIINSLYYYIQLNYVEEVDAEKLYAGALKGMLESLDDPYSVYMPKEDWRNLSDTTTGSFGGVGLSITKPTKNVKGKPAYVEVAQPIDDSPGARAGIQPGDKITKIDGTDTSTITMNEVLDRLRGTVGEPVTISILRGKNIQFDITLVRALIENPSVKYGMIRNTGYIRISEFSNNTADKVQEAIESFDRTGYDSIIIDLRNNGGGLLTAAVNIADKFIDEGTIVATKSRLAYENNVYTATPRKTIVDSSIPVIVLINKASASASEILAGAFKDAHRAYLVGENSYGKGSVQIPTPLIDNDGFKITVAKYYSPSDTNIDKVGIPPDREVTWAPLSEEEEQAFEKIMKSTEIADYVEAHPNMTEDDIGMYAVQLQEKYDIDLTLLRKLVRNQTDRTKKARLYDLDYDIQLNAALSILANEDIRTLTADVKTLKEIETEREAKKAAEEASKEAEEEDLE